MNGAKYREIHDENLLQSALRLGRRGDGQIHVYCRRNERYTEVCTLELDRFGGGGSVMVWDDV
jgi:hypothetical protein